MTDERTPQWRLSSLLRLADETNDRFVALARALMRLVDGSARLKGGGGAAPAPSPVEPVRSDAARPGTEADRWTRQLFHEEAQVRLKAARWLREHRAVEALSALEGVVRIEEDPVARAEMTRAAQELRAAGAPRAAGPAG